MKAILLKEKETNLEEFYINKECINESQFHSIVDFSFDISYPVNAVRSFVVITDYTVNNISGVVMTRLKTKTEFSLKSISADKESLKLVEQCVYMAYSNMLKHHKEKYKSWPLLYDEIVLPREQTLNRILNDFLLNLPY
ncbi:hypothetical protein [Rubrolithibacter danxiaensis]|uniref:hypothetical protein n=1 Tax=Rubrolithibacter danxiaensis TaxID=3390805 RepID=UPI003BF84537